MKYQLEKILINFHADMKEKGSPQPGPHILAQAANDIEALFSKEMLQKAPSLSPADIGHLKWIRGRLIEVHGENPNVDYLVRFTKIIRHLEGWTPPEKSDKQIICEFMGWEQAEGVEFMYYIPYLPPFNNDERHIMGKVLADMPFDTDWNWLIPVMGKMKNDFREHEVEALFGSNVIFNGVKEAFTEVVETLRELNSRT